VHYLLVNKRINTGSNGSISYKNLAKFGSVLRCLRCKNSYGGASTGWAKNPDSLFDS